MRFMPRYFAFFLLFALPVSGFCQDQDRSAGLQTAFARAQHLKRGINAAGWFAQSGNYSAARTSRFTDAQDIALIARLGFDNVRLTVDPAPLEQGPLGPDGLNADFLSRLDLAVDTMLADGLSVQLGLYIEESSKLQLRTSNEAVDRVAALWRKLAAHYATRNPDRVFFEIMNEPEVNDPYRWAGIQTHLAAAIREGAPRNTIIATGPNFSDIVDLLTQHPLADGNVIYTFHFYDPHEFTHQGASWGVSWWRYEHGIPYPATESTMKELVNEVPDPPDRYRLQLYWLDHWDAHRIQLLIDEGAAWGQASHVPVICNEFGAYRRVMDTSSRLAWLRDVRTALETDGIGWAMWDYRSDFGVVSKKDGEPAQPDPATVEALGLKK
jgi:hypothetical protein